MRKIALDIGTKRIGTAYSDERGALAFPGKIFKNTEKTSIYEYIKDLEGDTVVIGVTKDQSPLLKSIIGNFEKDLTELGYRVELIEEAMTSHEARLREFQKGDETRDRKVKMNLKQNIDHIAAMHILQRYLEKK